MPVNALAVAGVLIAGGWLYGSTLKGLGAEWASSPDSSYGLVLLVVALSVLFRRRRAMAEAASSTSSPLIGTLLLAGGVFLYIIGTFGAEIFLTRASAVFVAAGALQWLVGSRALRIALAPLTFLLIAIPLPALIVNAVTLPLQLVASRIAETSLMTAGFPVYRDGNLLMLPSVTLEVADACSGLRSLVSLLAIGALVAWADHRSIAWRAAIVASAVPIAIVMNGLRIAATGAACELWSPRAAAGGWHTFAGWITFVVSVAVLMTLSTIVRRLRDQPLPLNVAEPAGAL